MSEDGSQNIKLSAPNDFKTVKGSVQPGTAKLLIDPDGTVRIKADPNFPTPATQDKQKLFAACTDDGHTNVYYSPSGNPSEVYLLKPTAKSAGKQLIATKESINIKPSTVERKEDTLKPEQSHQNKSDPIVMSMIGKNTAVQTNKKSLLSSFKSLLHDTPSLTILPLPSVCSVATVTTSTSSSPADSPVDDSDFPIDLPVSFETDIKDSGVNSDIDELDSLLPDIGSTIAAHLQSKDSQEITMAQKENVVKSISTQSIPVFMPNTITSNNTSVKIPINYKNIATPVNVPMANTNGQLLLLTSGTGQNKCIFLSENQKLQPFLSDPTKLIPNAVTQNFLQPVGNASTLLRSSLLSTSRTTAPSVKPQNVVSLLKTPQKTVPRILTLGHRPLSSQTSVPVMMMPMTTPVINSTIATNSIQQTNVPVKVQPKSSVVPVTTLNKSGLKFVKSVTSTNVMPIMTQSTNPKSTATTIGNISSSQTLKNVVAKAIGHVPNVTSTKSVPIVCENVNNNNDNKKDDDAKDSEETFCNIRIDSVFSLSETSQTSAQSDEKSRKDGKRKRKNPNKDKKFKFVEEVKEYKCKPMYVVLERLAISKETVNVHEDTLFKTKCTDYCRKRTLNCMCSIDLLDCKNPILSSKGKYLQRRRIEILPTPPTKVARHSSDSDVKSRCGDDWTLVEEVPKDITQTGNEVRNPSLPDHCSYTALPGQSKSTNAGYGKKPKMSSNTVALLPTNVKSIDSKLPPTIQVPVTVPSTKQLNEPKVRCTATTTTALQVSKASTTTSSIMSTTSTSAPTKAKPDVMKGKFFLVKMDGKNILIPTDKPYNNKAYVLQQAADGTTEIVPASLSNNKVTTTAPVNTTASSRVATVNTKSVMDIRSIAPNEKSPVTPIASKTNQTVTHMPSGLILPPHLLSTIQNIIAKNVTKPQAVSPVTNTRLAAPDTKTKSSSLHTTAARPSNTETPSPTIDPNKKRKKTLAERYPLPPGVIIKQEPRTKGYGDEPKEPDIVKTLASTIPITSILPQTIPQRHLVQSLLTKHIMPKPSTTSIPTILTPSNTVNSKTAVGNAIPIQRMETINSSVRVTANNLRTVNVANKGTTLQPVIQAIKPRPPINIIKHFPVSHSVQTPPVSLPVLKNNVITFVKRPNSNVFESATLNIPNTEKPNTKVVFAKRPMTVLVSNKSTVDNNKFENISPPDSPGPPDLGEPQIILPPKVSRQNSNDSETDSDTCMNSVSYSFPSASSPVPEKRGGESKVKTPQQLRIEKLKEQLREQEKALEEMRRKKAFECPIDIDDD